MQITFPVSTQPLTRFLSIVNLNESVFSRTDFQVHIGNQEFIYGLRYAPIGSAINTELKDMIEIGLNGTNQHPLYTNLHNILNADNGLETIALTLPGHLGDRIIRPLSEFKDYSLEYYADVITKSVVEIATMNPNKRIVINGHSMGGRLAFMVMLNIKRSNKYAYKKAYKQVLGIVANGSSDMVRATFFSAVSVVASLPELAAGYFVAKIPQALFRGESHTEDQTERKRLEFCMKLAETDYESGRAIIQLGLPYPDNFRPILSLNELKGKKILIIYYSNDPMIKQSTKNETVKLFESSGADVNLITLQGTAHNRISTHPEEIVKAKLNWLLVTQKLEGKKFQYN